MSKHYNGVTRERVKKEVLALQKYIRTQEDVIEKQRDLINHHEKHIKSLDGYIEDFSNKAKRAYDMCDSYLNIVEEQKEELNKLRNEITRITTDLALERDQNRKDKGYKFGFYAMAIINAVIIIGVNL